MSSSRLPDRASLEYLRKLAKDRLREMRRTQPAARLSDAQLAIAREHGFASWRALKTAIDRRGAATRDALFTAGAAGDVDAVRRMLRDDATLVHARGENETTALHHAVRHPDVVQTLLVYGADPNVRERSDNALPLHLAAGHGAVESVRALLDAGSDVQGEGDLHHMDTIGWATCFAEARRDVVELLLSRGARHHVFSAIALGDRGALRDLVADEPAALQRRLSRFEQEQTALHYVVAPADGLVGGLFRTGDHYHTLELLIELGAELDAVDAKGRTPLEVAMLRGDAEAMRILHAAGARVPLAGEPHRAQHANDTREQRTHDAKTSQTTSLESLVSLGGSVARITPMLGVPDTKATVDWYRSIGFQLTGCHEEDGRMDWASVTLGGAEIMFVPSTDPWRGSTAALSLWLRTDRIDEIYAQLQQRQLARARAVLDGQPTDVPEVRFNGDLYTAFYGQREFSIRDPNGIELNFYQPLEP